MATKFKRGDVVLRPDSWTPRFPSPKLHRGKAIVLQASAKKVILCTFSPGHKLGPSNPHVGNYKPAGLKVVGKVKKVPKLCVDTLRWKKDFWERHPSMAEPRGFSGGRRRKRRRR